MGMSTTIPNQNRQVVFNGGVLSHITWIDVTREHFVRDEVCLAVRRVENHRLRLTFAFL